MHGPFDPESCNHQNDYECNCQHLADTEKRQIETRVCEKLAEQAHVGEDKRFAQRRIFGVPDNRKHCDKADRHACRKNRARSDYEDARRGDCQADTMKQDRNGRTSPVRARGGKRIHDERTDDASYDDQDKPSRHVRVPDAEDRTCD